MDDEIRYSTASFFFFFFKSALQLAIGNEMQYVGMHKTWLCTQVYHIFNTATGFVL